MSVARCAIFTVLIVCIFSSGCAMQPVYGNSWAEQVRLDDGACPDIDGTYRNAGERFDFDTHNRRIVSLAHLLNGGFSADAFQADHRLGSTTLNAADDPHQAVSLRLVEGALQVEATRTDGGARTFALPVRLRCRDSVLFIESDWSGGSVVLASGIGRTSLALGRAEDGSLRALASGSAIAFLFWLPIGMGSAADWTISPPGFPVITNPSARTQPDLRAASGLPSAICGRWPRVLTGGLFMPEPKFGPRLAAICVCTLLKGCFSTSAVIPDDWAEPVVLEGNDCPVIDGTYRNAGEMYEEQFGGEYVRRERSLAHILNGGTGRPSLQLWNRLGPTSNNPSADRFDSISLHLADGRLHVRATDAEGDGRAMKLPVHLRCRDSVLKLDVDWGRYVKLPGTYDSVGRISLALSRSADGSLLVRETESGSYFFLFTPVFAYRDAAWIRFEEAPATVVAAGSP